MVFVQMLVALAHFSVICVYKPVFLVHMIWRIDSLRFILVIAIWCILQENIVRPGKEPTDRECYITTLFRAYCGLVWYVEWKQCRHSLEQLKSSEEQETG